METIWRIVAKEVSPIAISGMDEVLPTRATFWHTAVAQLEPRTQWNWGHRVVYNQSFRPGMDYCTGAHTITPTPALIGLHWLYRAEYSAVQITTVESSINPLAVDSAMVQGLTSKVLETSIYNALTGAFVKEANLTRVASIAPFGFCFDSKNVGSTRVGPAVPSIDLVLQSESVYWRIFGANSMVPVRENVLCLGFVDGGLNSRTSFVIGGYQLENNLLQFDLATSRLGFSSSLLFRQTTCSNFNFTSNV
ncbi:hypothetical protein IFM89_033985 [Coptis chinensis]|uniref:Xylanase inhibitor C-terminal domain-containing protein n=1 Tax=Coptis chinensis TaxID=261450 RepID=A0A835M828_9MAGN|nr:hypothetical protein IFM89_033985 [Coptis chinensis]